MNKMKITSKRCFALLLVLMMCFSLLPMSALADDGVQQCEYCKWTGGNHAPNCPNGSGTSYDKDDKGKDEEETNKPVTSCLHTNYVETITESTCQVAGHKKIVCTDCGHVIQDEDCPKLEGHVFIDGKCKYCNEAEPTSEHKHTLAYCKGTPATCLLTGMKESWYCTGCGDHFSDENGTQSVSKDDLTIPVLEPDFGEWKDNGDRTQTRVCKNCQGEVKGHSETQPIQEHTHTLAYCKGTPATCTETGMEGSWYCTVPGCDAHFSDENGTQSVSKDDLTIPTLEPVFEGAEWIEQDELKHCRHCVNCDGEADGHTEFGAHVKFSEWETVKEATENEAGEEQRECVDCGYTQTREIPIKSGETEPPVEEKTITVTWLSGYGNNEAITTITINQGDNYSSQTPSNPTRSSYTFNGWGTPVVDPDTGNITITAQWTQNNNGSGGGIIVVPTPTPTPDDPNDPVDIPDNPVPGGGEPEDPNEPDDPVDIPDEPVPGGGEPEDPNEPDDPIVDITDPDVPTTDRPVIPTRPTTPTRPTDSSDLTEIEDEEVPLADTPETGDNVWVWYLTALLSAAGIAVLAVLENKKRAKH